MPDERKISFQLTARDKQRLEVRVQTPDGEARGESPLPAPALAEMLAERSARGKLNAKLVERIGAVLYGVLIGRAVEEPVLNSLSDARRDGVPLLFELRFDPDQVELTRYPWEMICNPEGEFLVRDGLVDLTRYVTYPQPPPSFDESIRGLPLFRVISSPPRLPALSTPPLGIAPVETLEHASFEAFSHRLLIDRIKLWGLHFDGHGALALQCPRCESLNGPADTECGNCGKPLANGNRVGALAFEHNGDVAWIPTREFGSVLYNAHARLALLLACETAKVGNKVVFSGLAPGLLLAGVPAVIGMQYPVLDSFAASFANQFYATLMKDNDIVGALRAARRMSVLDAWYSPALYLRRQPSDQEVAKQAVYLMRNIDTAAPARVSAGATFLTRLWIRRPETKPLTAAKLRAELDIPKDVPVKQAKGEAEVKFEPVPGRKLRRGEVDIKLTSKDWEISSDSLIKLFIDETLDAPPAIFTVKARTVGKQPLTFSVMQDGGVIHNVTHIVEALDEQKAAAALPEVTEHSQAINLDEKRKAPAALGLPASPKRGFPKGLLFAGGAVLVGVVLVIGLVLIIGGGGGGFGGGGGPAPSDFTPPGNAPTPAVSVESTQITPPLPISPNGDRLFCGRPVVLKWTEPQDPATIDSYEVEVQELAGGAWQTADANRYPDTGVSEMLKCPKIENPYHWRVRAWGKSGVASEWSQETDFTLFVPPTVAPQTQQCGPGWLPDAGCTCCGTTLVCADGTVAAFNPACGVGSGACTCVYPCPSSPPGGYYCCAENTAQICTP